MRRLLPVLYVEDEENDVLLMTMAFERAGIPHLLKVAENGREALDYLAGLGRFADRELYPLPALVLLDLNLPLLHGFEVLQRVRTELGFKDLPVVVFSSSEQPSDRARAEELGANAYIVKPAQVEHLIAIAKSLQTTWLSSGQRSE